jgi:hypothetical protein
MHSHESSKRLRLVIAVLGVSYRALRTISRTFDTSCVKGGEHGGSSGDLTRANAGGFKESHDLGEIEEHSARADLPRGEIPRGMPAVYRSWINAQPLCELAGL